MSFVEGFKSTFVSKGRARRPALKPGARTKNIRVKKEKLPTKFILNLGKGKDLGDGGKMWQGAKLVEESDEEEVVKPVAVVNTDGPNRKERREHARKEERNKEMAEAYGPLWRGYAAERRMSSQQRESLVDQRSGIQGNWMRYNYLVTHPSWMASKSRRRQETALLSTHGIDIFNDATKEQDGEEEQPEEEEDEEEEEEEEDIIYPSFLPSRNWVVYQ